LDAKGYDLEEVIKRGARRSPFICILDNVDFRW
jgi:hypothetical protein